MNRKYESLIVLNTKGKEDSVDELVGAVAKEMEEEGAKLDQIPRQGGRFLWSQYAHAIDTGTTMIYQAMFDEIDEGTAIFKCTNDPPVGASPFLTYKGLPSDHYLWLVGQGTRMLKGKLPVTHVMPTR